jgi:DNA-binding LacI/PurR family transcriptional regulator
VSGTARLAQKLESSAKSGDRPTIKVVAERAQVAISTVSRVLNGGVASTSARSRVQLAIQELGYAPSVAAQSLVTRRTGCVGLAASSSQSSWFSQILAGVEEALLPSRKSVLLASMMHGGQYDPSAVAAWIREGRVDGLVFARFARRNRALFNAAVRAALPVVFIAPDVGAPANFIARCDNVDAGRLVARHLAALGHRRISFAGGPQDSLDTRNRLKGFVETLGDKGIRVRARHVWFGPSYTAEAGIKYARRFLAEREADRPTAVVLGNDAMALGFMRVLLKAGIGVPHHVSVVGFDGIPEGELCWPGLTTVAQPLRRMAIRACQALLECIPNRDRHRATAIEYGMELLVRESTAAPRER